MKLLLTSAGLKNQALINALFELAGKSASELKAVIILTAANVENEDKKWLIDDLVRFQKLSFLNLDIVDFVGLSREQWLPRFEQADILIFEGGSTTFLVEKIKTSGLEKDLKDWMESKVYVGISAGSVMTGPVINPHGTEGLGWVDFLVVPHMNALFSKRTPNQIKAYAEQFKQKTFWLDDDSGIKIDGSRQQVIGGEWQEF